MSVKICFWAESDRLSIRVESRRSSVVIEVWSTSFFYALTGTVWKVDRFDFVISKVMRTIYCPVVGTFWLKMLGKR